MSFKVWNRATAARHGVKTDAGSQASVKPRSSQGRAEHGNPKGRLPKTEAPGKKPFYPPKPVTAELPPIPASALARLVAKGVARRALGPASLALDLLELSLPYLRDALAPPNWGRRVPNPRYWVDDPCGSAGGPGGAYQLKSSHSACFRSDGKPIQNVGYISTLPGVVGGSVTVIDYGFPASATVYTKYGDWHRVSGVTGTIPVGEGTPLWRVPTPGPAPLVMPDPAPFPAPQPAASPKPGEEPSADPAPADSPQPGTRPDSWPRYDVPLVPFPLVLAPAPGTIGNPGLVPQARTQVITVTKPAARPETASDWGTGGVQVVRNDYPGRPVNRDPTRYNRNTKQGKISIVTVVGPTKWALLNLITEGFDFVQALWEKLPDDAKRKFPDGNLPDPYTMAEDLWINLDRLDLAEAIEAIINEEIGDRVWALGGEGIKQYYKVSGAATGLDHALSEQQGNIYDAGGPSLGELAPEIDFDVTNGTVSLTIPTVWDGGSTSIGGQL